MSKTIFTDKIMVSDKIEGGIFLMEMTSRDKENVFLSLSDRGGTIRGRMPLSEVTEEVASLKGKVVKLNGFAIVDQGGKPMIVVRDIVLADESEYDMTDIYSGIPEEVLNMCMKNALTLIEYVSNPAYQKILKAFYRNDLIRRLPGTLHRHANIAGGMLASASMVTSLIVQSGKIYNQMGNGIYSQKLDSDILVTGGLLHNCGNILYYSEEMEKTDAGIALTADGCVQKVIDDLIVIEKIDISLEDYAELIAVLKQFNLKSAGVCPTKAEHVVAHNCYIMYSQMDFIDRLRTEFDGKEESERRIGFDSFMRRYVDQKTGPQRGLEKGGK